MRAPECREKVRVKGLRLVSCVALSEFGLHSEGGCSLPANPSLALDFAALVITAIPNKVQVANSEYIRKSIGAIQTIVLSQRI